jgi:hypothetical protein
MVEAGLHRLGGLAIHDDMADARPHASWSRIGFDFSTASSRDITANTAHITIQHNTCTPTNCANHQSLIRSAESSNQ